MRDQGRPPNYTHEELAAARASLSQGRVVRVALPDGTGRVALCETLDEVKAAQAGQIPRSAVRLDRGRS